MGISVKDISGLGSVADFAKSVVDKIFPDKNKALEVKAQIDSAALAGELADHQSLWENMKSQILVNLEEAKSPNWFVSGWRPFIGWTCGVIFAYNYLVYQIIKTILVICHWQGDINMLPVLAVADVMPVLLGMLGLGGMRTVEKVKDAEGNRSKS